MFLMYLTSVPIGFGTTGVSRYWVLQLSQKHQEILEIFFSNYEGERIEKN